MRRSNNYISCLCGELPYWELDALTTSKQERTMITGRSVALGLMVIAAVGLNANGATAQTYPSKPIRFIVPFPAGGSTDVGARLIAEYLSRAVGQQVYVENKSGANGNIGV